MLKKFSIAVTLAAAFHAGAFAQETIKVGLLNIDGGPFAVVSRYVADGAAFAIETLNAQGGALGRKYELVTQTHAGTPAGAVAAASRLVEQGGVSMVTGLNTSATSMAVTAKMATLNALFLDSNAASNDLTGKACNQNYFRITISDAMNMNAMRSLVKQSGLKNWDMLMADYAAGHDYGKGFTGLVQETGGKLGATLFAPLSTTDFGSYISQLGAKPADGLAIMFPGGGAIALAKQQQQFGLFSKYKTVLTAYFTNDTLIAAQGDTTDGLLTLQDYHPGIPGDRNAAFVKAFEARYKRKPTYLDGDLFMAIDVFHQAVLKAKSTDPAALRAALAGMKMQSIVGEVEMRAADHQLLRPLAVVQAQKTADGKGAIVFKAMEPVSRVAADPSPECKM